MFKHSRFLNGFLTCILLIMVFGFLNCAKRITYPSILNRISEDSYKDADGVVVFDSTMIKVNKNGTSVKTEHKMIKILTRYGKKKYGEHTFAFNKKWDTLYVVSARVYTPEGKIIEVTEENIDVYPMPAWEGAKFFIPNTYIVKITYPQVERLSAVEYKIKDVALKPLFDNHFQHFSVFENYDPIRQKTVEINIPEEMDLKWKVLRGDLSFKKEEGRKRNIYRWSAENVSGVVREASMPPLPDVATKLLLSTLPSWEYFSKWYYTVSKPTFEADSSIKELVADLIEEDFTREEKIRTLFNWTVENIRYVETELAGAKAGFKPALAATTLEREYGVCRDKAALLVALLKETGIKSRIVLTNPMMHVEDILPVDQFNHAIVAIKKDNDYYYLDPTAENSRQYLPAYEYNGKAVLVSTPKGEPLRYTPLQDAEKNKMEITGKSKLNEDNRLCGTVEIKTSGFMDFQFRNLFKKAPPEMTERIMTGLIKSNNPSAVIDTFYIEGLESLEENLWITIKYHIDDYATETGDILTLQPPMGGSRTMTMGRGRNPFALDERNYPINIMITMGQSYHEEMQLPSNYKVNELPEDFSRSNKYMEIKRSYEKDKNKIVLETEFALKRPEIPVDVYQEAKELQQEIDKFSKQKILLERR